MPIFRYRQWRSTRMKILLPQVMILCLLPFSLDGVEHPGSNIGLSDEDNDYSGSSNNDSDNEPCDCVIDFSDDEVNCSSDVRFQQVMKCDKTTVFIGNKCRVHENRVPDFSDFCDGVASCEHGEDEPRGQIGFKCKLTLFMKIPEWKDRCTVSNDLIDRWEDADLKPNLTIYSVCPNQEDICFKNGTSTLNISKCFQCLDGTVISAEQVCDEKADCLDLSDECLCLNKTDRQRQFCEAQDSCAQHQIAWGNENITYTCIDKAEIMEGKEMSWRDCPKCERPTKDQPDMTECYVDNVVAISVKKCDNRPRCPGDVEDECNDCPHTPEYCQHIMFGTHDCKPIDANASMKIGNMIGQDQGYHFYLCDGVVDCEGSTDENGCERIPCGDGLNQAYDKEERCDYHLDCDNGADEKNCSDAFYCGTLPGLPKEKIADGNFDCQHGEDECNYEETSFSSGQNMMKSPIFLVTTWILALMALIGNTMVVYSCSKDLHVTCKRGTIAANRARVGVCNKILVLNLAMADFLMGIYLLMLGIKAWEYNGIYCSKWQTWRSSTLCSGIGALAMLSSQSSVLIMVMMTTYRFYSVRSPFRAERLKARYLIAGVLLFCWLPPLFVAFIPLREKTMAFAFQPVARLRHLPTFIIKKSDFQTFITGALHAANKTDEDLGKSSWSSLISKYYKLFPKTTSGDDGNLVNTWYGYYSADSVCLPRLFPSVDDSGWEYTAGVIIFDFVAFIYILMAYSVMYICTVRRFSSTARGNTVFGVGSYVNSDKVRSREDRLIWRRISRLIITDFICWVPVCIACLVTLTGYKVSPLMYQISAMIFLPINSAVNPLLYSNIVCRTIERFVNEINDKIKATPGHTARTTRAASTSSKVHGVVASAFDETKESRDGLVSDNRSILASEADKNKNSCLDQESKRSTANEAYRNKCSASSSVAPLTSTVSARENKSALSECIAKLGLRRIFSERRVNDVPLDERSTLPRRHRPKSRSTTSTGTTFTSCGEV